MLNDRLDDTLTDSGVRSPIHFEHRNECTHCGAKKSLQFIDIHGNICHEEINPLAHLRCKECGTVYNILWKFDEDGNAFPCAIRRSIQRRLINIVTDGRL